MDAGKLWVLDHFAVAREKTLELVRAIPEEWFDRKAAGEEVPLKGVLAHVSSAIDYYMTKVALDGKPRFARPGKGRTGMIRALEKSRDRLLSFFETEGGKRLGQQFKEGRELVFTGQQMVDYLTDHEIHHRAKIVLALRQWGMKEFPPLNFNPNLAGQSRAARKAGAA